jgi:hypothetical protein
MTHTHGPGCGHPRAFAVMAGVKPPWPEPVSAPINRNGTGPIGRPDAV